MSKMSGKILASAPAGFIATAILLCLFLSGVGMPVEKQLLDFRFRHFSNAPQEMEIVRVDIEDGSIEQLGRWPWDRTVLADIIETLHTCGADTIAMDITFTESQKPRYISDAADIETASRVKTIGIENPKIIFDDAKLAHAIAQNKNVFLGMYLTNKPRQRSPEEKSIVKILDKNPDTSMDACASAIKKNDENANSREIFLAYLRSHAKRRADLLSCGKPAEATTRIKQAASMTPPFAPFIRYARGVGFVNYSLDSDGIVRSVAPLAVVDGNEFFQLGVALAVERMERKFGGKCKIELAREGILLSFPDGSTRILPTDEQGYMLINWMPLNKRRAVTRIPADLPAGISAKKTLIRKNRTRVKILCLTLAQAFGESEILELFKQADEVDAKIRRAELVRAGEILINPNAKTTIDPQLLQKEEEIEKKLDEKCTQFLEDDFYLQSTTPQDPERKLLLDARKMLARVKTENQKMRDDISVEMDWLKKRVSGKVCIIGSAATAAADFVTTPIAKLTPGVTVHVDVFNTILSGSFIRQAGYFWNILAIILLGVSVSFVTAWRPVFQSAPMTLLLAGVYFAFNSLVVFHLWGVWLILAVPFAAMFASFLFVTAYRQLTEERAKRHIRAMFAHAMSPALVDRLMADPSLAKLGGEKREITCFFADIAGFTTFSERMGEQTTVQVLNRYFDVMTEVIQNQQGGYVNKFLGDGIFVFFGAPVLQPDSAKRAITASIVCRREVEKLNEQLSQEFSGEVKLSIRIGITTGEAMVGNCGSTGRMDYTAIGDTVNLAARLESANKFFGTSVLVDGNTHAQASQDNTIARPIGKVQVVGKTEPVEIWQVHEQEDHCDEKIKRAFDLFAQAVQLFEQKNFNDAKNILQQVRAILPDDRPSEIYLDLCEEYTASPPQDGWEPTIKLQEK